MATKPKSMSYTRGETEVINSAWFTLMRCVEHSRLQESRLQDIIRDRAKHFGATSAKAHVMDMVRCGLKEPGPETLNNLSRDSNERVICYMVGVFLRSERGHLPEGPAMLMTTLEQAQTAWSAAHNRYLESVR